MSDKPPVEYARRKPRLMVDNGLRAARRAIDGLFGLVETISRGRDPGAPSAARRFVEQFGDASLVSLLFCAVAGFFLARASYELLARLQDWWTFNPLAVRFVMPADALLSFQLATGQTSKSEAKAWLEQTKLAVFLDGPHFLDATKRKLLISEQGKPVALPWNPEDDGTAPPRLIDFAGASEGGLVIASRLDDKHSFCMLVQSRPLGIPWLAPGLRIDVEYFLIRGNERLANRVRGRFTAIDRPVYYLSGLRPTAANHTVPELSQRFFERLKEEIEGRGVTWTVSDKRQQIEAFIENMLYFRLGHLDAGGESGEAPEFRTPDQLITWARRLNGSDAWGLIQFFTVVAGAVLILIAIARWMRASRQEVFLENNALFPEAGSINDAQFATLDRIRKSFPETTGGTALCIPVEILYDGFCAHKSTNGDRDVVRGFIEARASSFLDRIDTSYAGSRFFIWLIPSLGFIGTVIGIGNALLGTSDVLSENQLAQRGAIQYIAAQLGTAFDTTFVALVVCILCKFIVDHVQRLEEELVHESKEKTLRALISSAPLPSPPTHRQRALGVGYRDPPRSRRRRVSRPSPLLTAHVTRRRPSIHYLAIAFGLVVAIVASALLVPLGTVRQTIERIAPWIVNVLP